jgi:hypothetical protein
LAKETNYGTWLIMNNLQQNNLPGQQLDTFDRRILGALVEDSSQTYAELGRIVGLSAVTASLSVCRQF